MSGKEPLVVYHLHLHGRITVNQEVIKHLGSKEHGAQNQTLLKFSELFKKLNEGPRVWCVESSDLFGACQLTQVLPPQQLEQRTKKPA